MFSPDIDYSESIFSSTEIPWDHVVPGSELGKSPSRPVDLKADEQRAFADLFDEIFKAAEVASTPGSRPSAEESSTAPNTEVFSSEFYERIRRTPSMPRFGDAVAEEQFDRKKEEMNLCRNDQELLDWALIDVFAEAQTYEEQVMKMDVKTRIKRNVPLRPLWYPRIIALLMSTFRDIYHNPHTTLAIFNYVRSSSIASYAFGCSVDAYSELIKTHWVCFRDADAVLNVIREMQVNGIKLDNKTGRLLDTVRQDIELEKLWSEDEVSRIRTQLDSIRRDTGHDLANRKFGSTRANKNFNEWKVQELRDDPSDEKGFNKW